MLNSKQEIPIKQMLCVELNSFFLPSCPHLGHSALMQAEFANFFVFLNYAEKWRRTFPQVDPSRPGVWPEWRSSNSAAGTRSCLPGHGCNNITSSLKLAAWSSFLPHPNVCNKGNSELREGAPCLPTDGYLLISGSHPPSIRKGVISGPASPGEQRES